MSLTIQVPVRSDQTEFNLKRWDEVLSDSHYSCLDGTFETDRYGHVIHIPPPSFLHGRLQRRISTTLHEMMEEGETVTECPVSTPDGVKGVDVAWLSGKELEEVDGCSCLSFAPSICVEIKSPRNSVAELNEKKALYFEAGAKEVWICSEGGRMDFFVSTGREIPAANSILCPEFPLLIEVS